MKAKKAFLAILTVVISLCLCLLVMEIGIRLFVPTLYWPNRDPMDDWQLDKVLGWVQKPNISSNERLEYGWTVRFQTNEDGLTPGTAKREKQPGRLRIMLIGDSTVVGRAVPQGKTVSAQLEQFLKQHGINAEVINAAVQAYGEDQSLLRLKQLLPLYHPDIVIYGFCQNDLSDNMTDEIANKAKPIFKTMGSGEVKLIPPKMKDRLYPGGYDLIQWIRYSAIYRYLRPALYNIRKKLGPMDNKSNLISIDEFYYNPTSLSRVDWQLFGYLLQQMKQESQNYGAQFFFYAHPALQEVWEPVIKKLQQSLHLKPEQYDRYAIEKRLEKISAAENITFLPIIDYFRQREAQGPFHLLPKDPHCNQTGYRIIAERLYEYLSQALPGPTAHPVAKTDAG